MLSAIISYRLYFLLFPIATILFIPKFINNKEYYEMKKIKFHNLICHLILDELV